MKKESKVQGSFFSLGWLPAAVLTVLLTACGGSGSIDSPVADTSAPAAATTVVGTLDVAGTAQAAIPAAASASQPTLTMDDGTATIPIDAQGHFEVANITDGDHSLYLHQGSGVMTEIPFRMLEGRGLDLGTVTIRDGHLQGHTGFDGYHFGFVDENGDGVNDHFADANGDGICDQGHLYAGYSYMMDLGFVDANHDGVNDRFRDADGDGLNDVDQMPYGHGFGFVDENHDGVNDYFVDANGDGICDLTGMPFGQPFGFLDQNQDGINDLFVDANGDGIDDLTNLLMPYGHCFGWIDANGDGINDRFIDANGDGINDYTDGPFAQMPYHYGFARPHADANGDGMDDQTGYPYCQRFGWVDADGDGVNDAFTDTNGDGVNDWTGYHYDMGYHMEPGFQGGHMGGGIDWPMHGGGMMM